MGAEKVAKIIDSEETGTDSSTLPEDIDFNKRREIIRKELERIVGKPKSAKQILEKRRLKDVKFHHEKNRNKIAVKSRRRNLG